MYFPRKHGRSHKNASTTSTSCRSATTALVAKRISLNLNQIYKSMKNRRDNNCDHRIHSHFGTYRRTDIFCGNLFFTAKLVLHIRFKSFSLFKVKSLCLNTTWFVPFTVCTCTFLSPVIFQVQAPSDCQLLLMYTLCQTLPLSPYRRQIKAVIQRSHVPCGIDSHNNKSAQAKCDRKRQRTLFLSVENRSDFSLLYSVRILSDCGCR